MSRDPTNTIDQSGTSKQWLGMQPVDLFTYAGQVYPVWENCGFMRNALLGIWPTDEESQPFYKGFDRGHKGYANVYEAFTKTPKLLKKCCAKFELEQTRAQSTQGVNSQSKQSINSSLCNT
eukprot:15317446-Ditylum_brightwellii.AAC.1